MSTNYNYFGPYEGLHVYLMTPQYAERWTRNAYHVADDVMLGWKPYTILVQSYGATAYKAFHSTAELRNWLGGKFALSLGGWRHRGFRGGRVVAKVGQS